MSIETREIPSLSFRAEVAPESIDLERRTVELVWTTGAMVRRGFFDPFNEELSLDPKHVRMGRLTSGNAPLLDSHDGFSLRGQLGVVEAAALKKGSGVATVRFSRRADVEPIWQDVRDGIIRNVSVGYRVHKYTEVDSGGDGERIRTMRAVDWEPYEVSLVPMPADSGATVRSESAPRNACLFERKEKSTMLKTKPVQGELIDAEEAAAPQETRAAPVATAPAQNAAPDLDKARTQGQTEERARIAGIVGAVRAARLGEDVATKLIDSGMTLDKARAQVLEMLAAKDEANPTHQQTRVQVTEDQADKRVRGISSSIIVRAGFADLVREAAKKRPDLRVLQEFDADPGEFRGMALVDIARDVLEARGVRTRGMDRMKLAGQALVLRDIGGMTGSTDFPILMETAMHKVLLAAYATQQDTWRLFCATGSVSDFRDHNRYRLGSFGTLDALNEHGEYKRKAIPDGEKATVSISTKGNIIGLTRKAIINDDLGAFVGLAAAFGRSAGRSIESDVYALINENSGLGPTQSDSQPFMHSNRDNVNGTGSALSAAGLQADKLIMAAQMDPSGNDYLDLMPTILLVHNSLEVTARILNESRFDVDGQANINPNKPNSVNGMFSVIVGSQRLTDTKRRYLLVSPSVAPVFEVDFLNGEQNPFMETQPGWNVDGTEWKVRLDYGVNEVDFRGIVTNAGQ